MLTQDKYNQILNFFDNNLWDTKANESNWTYYGIILDYFFDSSVLSIDYLDINEYFYENGKFEFVDTALLVEQYEEIKPEKRLKLIENILNILKHSKIDEEKCISWIQKVSSALKRNNIKVTNPEFGYLTLISNEILASGSYCNVRRVSEGILKKELIQAYQNDQKLQKRIKYEFENMKKLSDCPQILNVYDYNADTHTYLMEQAEMNLYEYLNTKLMLEFDEKLKIIMDVLKGMKYAHNSTIIHRDLHLGNVLKINNDFVICDFGLSKDLSIERSMKSSYTEKNNHLFVDPLAINDFTKLDQSSDIYSIGKIIDYVFLHNEIDTNHIFKTVVERCISRNKDSRYSSCTEIMEDINQILKSLEEKNNKQDAIEKIIHGHLDSQVHEFIFELIEKEKLAYFIVQNNLYKFGELLLKFEYVYQRPILNSINQHFVNATGYRGWGNYDIFANISYHICTNTSDNNLYRIAEDILEECARVRHSAENLLDEIQGLKLLNSE